MNKSSESEKKQLDVLSSEERKKLEQYLLQTGLTIDLAILLCSFKFILGCRRIIKIRNVFTPNPFPKINKFLFKSFHYIFIILVIHKTPNCFLPIGKMFYLVKINPSLFDLNYLYSFMRNAVFVVIK